MYARKSRQFKYCPPLDTNRTIGSIIHSSNQTQTKLKREYQFRLRNILEFLRSSRDYLLKSKCCPIFCYVIYLPDVFSWASCQPLFKWFIQSSKVLEILNSLFSRYWVHNLSLLSTQRCTTFIKCENWNGDNSENDSQSVTGIELSKSAVPSTNVGADINIPSSDIQKVCPRISELYICKRG